MNTIPAPYAENTGLPQSLPELYYRVKLYTLRFPTNLHASITSLPLKNYIRLLWIVCAYILVRPYIEKGFQKWMTPDHEKLRERAKAKKREEAAALGDEFDDYSSEAEEEEEGIGAGDIRSGTNVGVKPSASATPPTGTTKSQSRKGKANNNNKAAKTTSSEISSSFSSSSSKNTQEWGQSARKRQAAFFEELENQKQVGGGKDEGMDPALLKGWDY